MRWMIVLLALLGAADRAAGDPPASPVPARQTPEQAAAAVVEAWRARDEVALASLAANDDPDPWSVADELIGLGERDAADAFSKASPRKDVEGLPALLAAQRTVPDDGVARRALGLARAALEVKDGRSTLAALGDVRSPEGGILSVRVLHMRALGLRLLERWEEAAAAHLAAADVAERMGWLAMAARDFQGASRMARLRADFPGTLSAAKRSLAVEELRGDAVAAARALAEVGSAYESAGDPGAALPFLERALERQTAIGDRAGAAVSLVNLGNVHWSLGDRRRAVATFERALAEKRALGDRRGAAASLANLGAVRFELGDLAAARELVEEARAEFLALGDRRGTASALVTLGSVQHALGEFEKAIASSVAAAAEAEALGDRQAAATALSVSGAAHRSLGNFRQSLEAYVDAVTRFAAIGDRPGEAASLVGLGSVQQDLGNAERSFDAYGRALALQESFADRSGAATTRMCLAYLHGSLGQYARALAVAEEAVPVLRTAGMRAQMLAASKAIAIIYYSLGDRRKALEIGRTVLAGQEALGSEAGTADALHFVAECLLQLGRPSEALEGYERAWVALRKMGDRRGAAVALSSIGLCFTRLSRYDEAAERYSQALREAEGLGARQSVAHILTRIAELQELRGEDREALATLDRAVRESERLRANDLLARSLNRVAWLRLRAGEPARALEVAHRAVTVLEDMLVGLGEETAAAAREPFAELFAVGAESAARVQDPAAMAFFLESGRAGALLESLGGRERVRWAGLPAGLRAEEAEARAKESAALQAFDRAVETGAVAAIREKGESLDRARDVSREVTDRIQRTAKDAASILYPRAATMEEIQRSLETGDAFVLYGVGSDVARVLVLTRVEARIVDLGAPADVAAACAALVPVVRDADSAAAIARGRDLLIRPLRLGSAKRLLVSPEGPLCYVPFAALVPDQAVALLPSGTTYRFLLEEREERGDGVLALGDPDYTARIDERALALLSGGAKLTPLPGTRAEAEAVGDVVLLGPAANAGDLKASLAKRPRWRAVHLACHGLVDPERPSLSSLALTPSGDDGGFLTAADVFRTPFPADLVALSACETGKGRLVRGEGVVGLARAFMFAGPPRVVCSLWKVDDEATRALMTKFYALWNPKDGSKALGAAEALRGAQAYVRELDLELVDEAERLAAGREVRSRVRPWAHPYYWAGWVLWGRPD